MIPVCPGCDGPVQHRLCVQYKYPRNDFLPEAVDPWYVHGSAPLLTCGSPACGAVGLLSVIDRIVTDVAVTLGRLLDPDDVHVLQVAPPGEIVLFVVDDGES